MEDYVILYGKKHGQELSELFEKCDFGIGSLGRHRVGIEKIKTLKNPIMYDQEKYPELQFAVLDY